MIGNMGINIRFASSLHTRSTLKTVLLSYSSCFVFCYIAFCFTGCNSLSKMYGGLFHWMFIVIELNWNYLFYMLSFLNTVKLSDNMKLLIIFKNCSSYWLFIFQSLSRLPNSLFIFISNVGFESFKSADYILLFMAQFSLQLQLLAFSCFPVT